MPATGPCSGHRLPELLLVALGDGEDAMRRASVVGFGRHGLVLSILSPPQWRPRCPFQGRGGKAVLSQAGRRPPEGAELHKRSAEASGFDSNARLGRTGHKERTPCWRGQVGSKGR